MIDFDGSEPERDVTVIRVILLTAPPRPSLLVPGTLGVINDAVVTMQTTKRNVVVNKTPIMHGKLHTRT